MIDVDTLEAGRELDALIAEHLFGWTWWEQFSKHHGGLRKVMMPPQFTNPKGEWRPAAPDTEPWPGWDTIAAGPPEFSTDIGTAWQIVEWARAHMSGLQWERFCRPLCENWMLLRGSAHGDAPWAICRAALKVVLMEKAV